MKMPAKSTEKMGPGAAHCGNPLVIGGGSLGAAPGSGDVPAAVDAVINDVGEVRQGGAREVEGAVHGVVVRSREERHDRDGGVVGHVEGSAVGADVDHAAADAVGG